MVGWLVDRLVGWFVDLLVVWLGGLTHQRWREGRAPGIRFKVNLKPSQISNLKLVELVFLVHGRGTYAPETAGGA